MEGLDKIQYELEKSIMEHKEKELNQKINNLSNRILALEKFLIILTICWAITVVLGYLLFL